MVHITLSISDEIYRKMKEHPEIKWSEIARAGIVQYIGTLGGKTTTQELLNSLSLDAQKAIKDTSEKTSKQLYKKVVDAEWKELKS